MATVFDTLNNRVLAPSKDEIASLTPARIARLSFEEMIEVVVASGISVHRLEQIRDFDGDTLVRLVYSARRHCRSA